MSNTTAHEEYWEKDGKIASFVENEPGVVYISTDLLRIFLTDLGWEEHLDASTESPGEVIIDPTTEVSS